MLRSSIPCNPAISGTKNKQTADVQKRNHMYLGSTKEVADGCYVFSDCF